MAIDPNKPPSHLLPQFVLADPFPGSEPLAQLPPAIAWEQDAAPPVPPVHSKSGFSFAATADPTINFVFQDADGVARTIMTVSRKGITVDPSVPCDKTAEEVLSLMVKAWPQVTRVSSEASAIEVLVGLSDQRFAEVMVKVFAERMSRIVFSSESSTPR